jgi:hypothetical protein
MYMSTACGVKTFSRFQHVVFVSDVMSVRYLNSIWLSSSRSNKETRFLKCLWDYNLLKPKTLHKRPNQYGKIVYHIVKV